MTRTTLAASAALVLVACTQSPPPAEPPVPVLAAEPQASIPPAPTVNYTCERGTNLTVKQLGATMEVSVNGGEVVTLPVLGDNGTTYTNGRQSVYVKQGELSFAVGRMAAEKCTPDA